MHAIQPVVDRAIGDVEVAGLLRCIAIGGSHCLSHGDHRVPIIWDHVGGDVSGGVAVGPQDQLCIGMEVDRDRYLLFAADHA
jgi:hypothetical protein